MSEILPEEEPTLPVWSCPVDPAATPVTPDEDPEALSYGEGIREYQADFVTPEAVLTPPLTLLRRPDAIAFDALTAFTLGPVAQGDNSQGAAMRVWYARAAAGSVVVAAGGSLGWEAEAVLFNYAGSPIIELDLAFDQNGRVVVVAERATGAGGSSEIWIYYFNSVSGLFEFTMFDSGRTPRCSIDDVVDSANSDVLVFYMQDVANKLVYRMQRDRYLIRYDLTIPALNSFVEDVYRTVDYRVHVVYSIRNVVTGKYELKHIESTLYPIAVSPEGAVVANLLMEGELFETLLVKGMDAENLQQAYSLQSGALQDPVIIVSVAGPNAWNEIEGNDRVFALQSGTLLAVLITYPYAEIEGNTRSYALQSGTMPVVVVVYPYSEIEGNTRSYALQSGTLVTA